MVFRTEQFHFFIVSVGDRSDLERKSRKAVLRGKPVRNSIADEEWFRSVWERRDRHGILFNAIWVRVKVFLRPAQLKTRFSGAELHLMVKLYLPACSRRIFDRVMLVSASSPYTMARTLASSASGKQENSFAFFILFMARDRV